MGAKHSITKYQMMMYGGEGGYQSCRAQINLHTDAGLVGFIKFHDEGQPLGKDSDENNRIIMHLPMSQFHHVVDMLRNEKPINFYYVANAFLSTDPEAVGIKDEG